MKVRIHIVAKDLDRPSQEVLEAVHKLGVDAKTHSSTIDESLIPRIKEILKKHAAAAEDKHGKRHVAKAEEPKEAAPHKAPAAAHKAPAAAHKAPAVAHKAPAVTHKVSAVHKPAVAHPREEKPKKAVAHAPAVAHVPEPKAKPARKKMDSAVAVEEAPVPVEVAVPKAPVPVKPAEPAVSEEELERLTAPEKAAPPAPERPKIQISENIAIKDLASKMGIMSKVLLKKLLDRGILVNINQNLDLKIVSQLAGEFGYDVEVTSYEEVVAREQEAEETAEAKAIRPPVVTIMGHVDHGKTSLLDAIRESNIAGGESGGITQHIGAYQVKVGQRAITFIDTPGHEAFTRMRARGAHVTDIVVLVVAADDGVMPQTLEAIDHAKAAKVPIVVAINKIDKADANPEKIKQQLAQHGILIEEYGGDTVCVAISARKKINIDTLLEMILLVADILELKASPVRMGTGTVLEARLDKSRGPIATVLMINGTLHVGDVFVAGAVMGRVRAMFNDQGEKLKEVPPGTPVEVLGFQGVAQAGDSFQVFKDEFKARGIVAFRQTKAKEQAAAQASARLSLDHLFSKIQQGEIRELPIIIKADVQGSIEVLGDTLTKLGTDEVGIRIIHRGTGAITLSDVLLASASNAIIIGYNVRPEPKARELAEKEKVDIRAHTVIYDIVSEIKSALEGLLQPTLKEVFLGSVEVRQTFRIPKVGIIAGCFVTAGKITRSAQVRLLRDHIVVWEGKISSLKRFKDDASEVKEGFECGIGLENYNDIKVGDVIEAFMVEKIARQLA